MLQKKQIAANPHQEPLFWLIIWYTIWEAFNNFANLQRATHHDHHCVLSLLSNYPDQSRTLPFTTVSFHKNEPWYNPHPPHPNILTNQSGELTQGTQETETTVAL